MRKKSDWFIKNFKIIEWIMKKLKICQPIMIWCFFPPSVITVFFAMRNEQGTNPMRQTGQKCYKVSWAVCPPYRLRRKPSPLIWRPFVFRSSPVMGLTKHITERPSWFPKKCCFQRWSSSLSRFPKWRDWVEIATTIRKSRHSAVADFARCAKFKMRLV